MIATVGLFLCLIAGVNAAWVLIWFLLSVSGTAGAKLSKKTKFNDKNTEKNIALGEDLSRVFFKKFLWRISLMVVGYLMYAFGV